MTIVPDFDHAVALPVPGKTRRAAYPLAGVGGSRAFWRAKSAIDIVGALFLLPFVAALALFLIVLNPVFNPGPLIFRQRRMGQNRVPFIALKFRTMILAKAERGPHDPVEVERITPLGRILRRMGLDELPQALNVLSGEMSLIGPRPDCVSHAEEYLAVIPEYSRRFCVRPGISGLSQIRLGYAVGTEATRAKARTDMEYIARASFEMELWIVWRTVVTVLTGRGD
ncbi:MAG TPA: sugar transferase [Roseibacterium sp.]|nr:sugar transferase [Roseibacterium sp.]